LTSHNCRRRYNEIYVAAASLFGVPLFLILLNRSGKGK